jgi:hypothetical protein
MLAALGFLESQQLDTREPASASASNIPFDWNRHCAIPLLIARADRSAKTHQRRAEGSLRLGGEPRAGLQVSVMDGSSHLSLSAPGQPQASRLGPALWTRRGFSLRPFPRRRRCVNPVGPLPPVRRLLVACPEPRPTALSTNLPQRVWVVAARWIFGYRYENGEQLGCND